MNSDSHVVDQSALERFVVENNELLRLEELIGRFNIFDALGIVRAEIRHSNFLAWLLDPSESHGQGSLFLSAILMDLLGQCPADLRPFSPIHLDGAELRGVRVLREHHNIDILIECSQPRFVIAIENKIDSGEHSDQLDRYTKTVEELFGQVRALFVFLTREGDEPSDAAWTTYTYRDIHSTLARVRKVNEASIGDDVLTFLDHYLNMIGSRFMDDPTIDELCQTIYKNHRQAIDLIFDRIGLAGSETINAIAEDISTLPGWMVSYRGPTYLEIIPSAWEKMLPPVGKRKIVPPEQWLAVWIKVGKNQCYCLVRVAPTSDPDLRRRVIERLVADPKEFSTKSLFKSVELIGDNWATLGRVNIDRWNSDEGPDLTKLLPKIRDVLDRRSKELAGVPHALSPMIADWLSQQKPR